MGWGVGWCMRRRVKESGFRGIFERKGSLLPHVSYLQRILFIYFLILIFYYFFLKKKRSFHYFQWPKLAILPFVLEGLGWGGVGGVGVFNLSFNFLISTYQANR